MQPAAPIIGSTSTAATSPSIASAERVDVVVHDPPEVERGEQCLTAVPEVQQTAVVRAVDDDDPVATRVVARELDRHQIGFRAGVREADLLDRRKAVAHRLGEADLVDVDTAVAPAALERAAHRGRDRRGVVAEQAGRVVAEEVDVLVAVDVDDPRSLGARDPERERQHVEHRSRRSCREHDAGALEQLARPRPATGVPIARRFELLGTIV